MRSRGPGATTCVGRLLRVSRCGRSRSGRRCRLRSGWRCYGRRRRRSHGRTGRTFRHSKLGLAGSGGKGWRDRLAEHREELYLAEAPMAGAEAEAATTGGAGMEPEIRLARVADD